MGPGQKKSSQQARGRVLLSSPLTEEEIEAQRQEVTCPEAQSREMAEGAQGGLCGEAGAWAPGCRARRRPQSACVTSLGHSHGRCDRVTREPQPAFTPPPRPLGLRAPGGRESQELIWAKPGVTASSSRLIPVAEIEPAQRSSFAASVAPFVKYRVHFGGLQ